jgi:large subunit ribosomal protein L29
MPDDRFEFVTALTADFGFMAAPATGFGFVTGHDFCRAARIGKNPGLQPLKNAPERMEMEIEKIRNLSDAELEHQARTSAEQLFRLRFQVAMGQNDGVKKLRQLRKEIAQIKTIARERELGIRGAAQESDAPASASTAKKGAR